jgi:hypothetical protein
MRVVPHGIFPRFLLLAVGFILTAFLFCFYFQMIPLQQKHAHVLLQDKGRTLLALTHDPLARALAKHDDVAVLDQIGALMRSEDVTSVYVLDPDGRVVMHDKTGEWGQVYADPLSRKAVASRGALLQPVPRTNTFLFSSPLSSSATLCIGLSGEKVSVAALYERRNAAYLSMIVFALLAGGLAVFYYFGVVRRMEVLQAALSSPEALRAADLRHEFGTVADAVLRLVESAGEDRHGHDQEHSARETLLKTLASADARCLLVLDGENRCVYAGDGAWACCGMTDAAELSGKHVLDIVRERETMARLLKETGMTGRPACGEINGRGVQVLLVRDGENRPSGAIVRAADGQ